MLLGFFLLLLSYAATKLILTPLGSLLARSGMTKKNYRGNPAPTALGLVFLLTLPLSYACLILAGRTLNPTEIYLFLFFVVAMGLSGLCDDLLKTDEEKGFRGHFAQLLKGNLTSGGLKALTGLVFALIFTVGLARTTESSCLGWLIVFPQTVMAALAANSVNLFDLRPGRALKLFFCVVLALLIFLSARGIKSDYAIFLFPVTGGVLAYWPTDLKARGMLGDTGANFLGALLGAIILLIRDSSLFWFSFIFLILLQLWAEKYSLSQVIENNGLLRFLDRLGRD